MHKKSQADANLIFTCCAGQNLDTLSPESISQLFRSRDLNIDIPDIQTLLTLLGSKQNFLTKKHLKNFLKKNFFWKKNEEKKKKENFKNLEQKEKQEILDILIIIFGLLIKTHKIIKFRINEIYKFDFCIRNLFKALDPINRQICSLRSLKRFLERFGKVPRFKELQVFILRVSRSGDGQKFTLEEFESYLRKEMAGERLNKGKKRRRRLRSHSKPSGDKSREKNKKKSKEKKRKKNFKSFSYSSTKKTNFGIITSFKTLDNYEKSKNKSKSKNQKNRNFSNKKKIKEKSKSLSKMLKTSDKMKSKILKQIVDSRVDDSLIDSFYNSDFILKEAKIKKINFKEKNIKKKISLIFEENDLEKKMVSNLQQDKKKDTQTLQHINNNQNIKYTNQKNNPELLEYDIETQKKNLGISKLDKINFIKYINYLYKTYSLFENIKKNIIKEDIFAGLYELFKTKSGKDVDQVLTLVQTVGSVDFSYGEVLELKSFFFPYFCPPEAGKSLRAFFLPENFYNDCPPQFLTFRKQESKDLIDFSNKNEVEYICREAITLQRKIQKFFKNSKFDFFKIFSDINFGKSFDIDMLKKYIVKVDKSCFKNCNNGLDCLGDLDKVFKRFDKDKDGKISFKDFLKEFQSSF